MDERLFEYIAQTGAMKSEEPKCLMKWAFESWLSEETRTTENWLSVRLPLIV